MYFEENHYIYHKKKIKTMANQIKGKISQIISPVIDVLFKEVEELQKFMMLLKLKKSNGETVVLEVEQHIGEDMVRCISMDATDGFTKRQEVVATETKLHMPTGDGVNGRLLT